MIKNQSMSKDANVKVLPSTVLDRNVTSLSKTTLLYDHERDWVVQSIHWLQVETSATTLSAISVGTNTSYTSVVDATNLATTQAAGTVVTLTTVAFTLSAGDALVGSIGVVADAGAGQFLIQAVAKDDSPTTPAVFNT
jgi:hypothetical protein